MEFGVGACGGWGRAGTRFRGLRGRGPSPPPVVAVIVCGEDVFLQNGERSVELTGRAGIHVVLGGAHDDVVILPPSLVMSMLPGRRGKLDPDVTAAIAAMNAGCE